MGKGICQGWSYRSMNLSCVNSIGQFLAHKQKQKGRKQTKKKGKEREKYNLSYKKRIYFFLLMHSVTSLQF